MKFFKSKFFWVFFVFSTLVLYFVSCTHDDQVLDVTPTSNSTTDLVSLFVTTPPIVDGTIEDLWANAQKLDFEGVVPDPGGDLFRGLVGNVMRGTLRSMYDKDNVYFLAEWNDATKSTLRQPWYFDPATKKWLSESGAPTFSATGSITRPAFGEDKIAFLWNINKSVSGWNSGTCYKSCHTGMSMPDGYARHRTNSAAEKVDMWHWKAGRLNVANQVDDQYQDNTYPNGRKSDAAASGGDKSNSQTLNQPGIGNVSVPKYVIPGRKNYPWILQSEIDNGTAKLITAVDANGVLTLSDATTIDPNVGTDYQRVGLGTGPNAIPGISTSAFVGSRGDITCTGIHTGTGWIVEFKRALKTADSANDVDFSSLENQYFGVGLMDNTSAAHAIKGNLILKFGK